MWMVEAPSIPPPWTTSRSNFAVAGWPFSIPCQKLAREDEPVAAAFRGGRKVPPPANLTPVK